MGARAAAGHPDQARQAARRKLFGLENPWSRDACSGAHLWPPQPTLVDPKRFPDSAAAITQLFVRAHIVLAGLKAHGE